MCCFGASYKHMICPAFIPQDDGDRPAQSSADPGEKWGNLLDPAHLYVFNGRKYDLKAINMRKS